MPAVYRTETAPVPVAAPPRKERSRYFDFLRAAALVRVFLYHMFPFAWLSMVFPSMGVMFALGGTLMATSMRRSVEQAITGRLRRLLPALWAMAILVVPVMLLLPWPDRPHWTHLGLWVLPVVEPPSASWASPIEGVLWYLVAYLWLVLLSPLLHRLYRMIGLVAAALPIAGVFVFDYYDWPLPMRVESAMTDVLTFAGCWILGFAHNAGVLRKIRWAVLLPIAAVLVGAGLWWTVTHPGEEGIDLANEPVAYAVYSAGFVLLLFRINPRMAWLERVRPLNGLVNFCNARAVTIYLWHNAAIDLVFVAAEHYELDRFGDTVELAGLFVATLALVAIFVALLGWVEDVAARRPVSLLPWGKVPASRPRKETPEWCGPVWF
ncbi:acyltransferase [Actinoplanes sp. NPDC049265]|uniref:acyltransferase family protein n=1 Tax=Actinoplanes sp. NPDC049265 TaxID=3363902 RepID=UPI0037222985